MRVLVYPHSMELGGSQLNAVELAGAVAARGHEVVVFSEDGPLVQRLAGLGVEHVLARRPRVRPSPTLLAQLCRTVAEHRVDVVHGYEWPPALEAVCGPQLRLGVPAVATVMSMSVAPFVPRALPLAVGTRQIYAAERAHRPRLTLLEPPVDTAANAPGDRAAARASLGLADDDFVVVVVSRLAVELKREGLLAAVRAAGLLAGELPVRLVVAGDGPCRAEVEAAAVEVDARAGRSVVVRTGGLEDPRPVYRSADVALGMGGSALRAAAFGVPVVVQGERGFWRLLTAGSLPVFLEQGWYGLGDGGDGAPVLADVLRRLHADPAERARLGALALATVRGRFSLERAADVQEAVYAEAVSAPPAVLRGAPGLVVPVLRALAHDLRRKAERRRGTLVSDDFNAVAGPTVGSRG